MALPIRASNSNTAAVGAVENQPRVNLLQLRQNAKTRERNKTEAKQRKKDMSKPSCGRGSGASTSKASSVCHVGEQWSYVFFLQEGGEGFRQK
jgi:hypothetical protein